MSASTSNTPTDSRPHPHRHQSSRGGPLRLLTESAPARPVSTSPTFHQQSQSPFRYLHFESTVNEKGRHEETPLDTFSRSKREGYIAPPDRRSTPCPRPSSAFEPSSRRSSSYSRAPSTAMLAVPRQSLHSDYAHHRRYRLYALLKPWLPLIVYLLTSLGFLFTIAVWKEEVFKGMCFAIARLVYVKNEK